MKSKSGITDNLKEEIALLFANTHTLNSPYASTLSHFKAKKYSHAIVA